MSQWSGTFNVTNSTSQSIYNVQVSHKAAGCPTQTPVNASVLAVGANAGGGTWETETTSNDDWYWNYNLGSDTGTLIQGSKQCNLEKDDTSCNIALNSTGVVITPSSSSACTGSND